MSLSATDEEFAIYAIGWTGTLTLAQDANKWQLSVVDGVLAVADAVTPQPDSYAHVLVSAPTENWTQLLTSPPLPRFTDINDNGLTGLFAVEPYSVDANRQNALRRFSELLRFAATGGDASPVAGQNRSQHGVIETTTGHYIHLDLDGIDHRIYFEEAGEGIPLLCQHTAGADGRQWRHVLNDTRITDHFRVIVYDLPWHGRSLPPDGIAWWTQDYRLTAARAMAVPVELSRALGLQQPVFMGASIGGGLALALARYHADDFRAVVSLSGALWIDNTGIDEGATFVRRQTLADPALHAGQMMIFMSGTAPEQYRQETRFVYSQGAPGVLYGDLYFFCIDLDLREETDNFDTEKCSVYLMTGNYDFRTLPLTLEAGRAIAGSHVQVMDGLGHFPMSEDHDALTKYLLPVLDEIAVLPDGKESS